VGDLTDIVGWWRANVTPGHRPGRRGTKELHALIHVISMEQAEKEIGFSQPQISRIAKRLTDRMLRQHECNDPGAW
jgi:hypothetical protein